MYKPLISLVTDASVKISHLKGRIQIEDVRFEVLTAIVVNSSVVWDKTPCNPLTFNRLQGLIFQKTKFSRLRVFESRALARIFGPKREAEKVVSKTCKMRSMKFCNLLEILE
jgi:hypothetical protein